jgi:hypothetical protein
MGVLVTILRQSSANSQILYKRQLHACPVREPRETQT